MAWLNTGPGLAWATSIGLPNPPRPVPTGECTASTIQPQIQINSPTNGQQLTGAVQITGIASGPEFARYQIELAPASAPENFQVIAGPFSNQANGALATWDSTLVPNGAYRMRLAAFSTNNGFRNHTIDIGVNNIIPTQPPPTLPPIVVPTLDPIFTPIPPISNQGGPTPTIFLGG
jgi:hypothetical protein